MTDNELKFYDPETGAELHRVQQGGVIKRRTPYGYVHPDGSRGWLDTGHVCDFEQTGSIARFTREPIAPPRPPLPTGPGLYFDKDGDLWHVDDSGKRAILTVQGSAFVGDYYPWGEHDIPFAPFVPASIVPTETWDRLRVLDPEDKRDRVDRDGDVWEYSQKDDSWVNKCGDELLHPVVIDYGYGPLRFADEVNDR